MMSKRSDRLSNSTAIIKLVSRLMPLHRKEWTDSVLNELAYIESRRARVRWLIGSLLFAIRERSIYELENASMNIRPIKTILVLVAVAVGTVAGTYAIQKPYQQDRIKFAVHRLLNAQRT